MILPSNLDETIPAVCNTAAGVVLANIAYASALHYPWLSVEPPTPRPAVLVGGGPSVLMYLETIRTEQQAGAAVFAMNGTGSMLANAGITPDYLVLADSQPETARFLGMADTNLISAQCHSAVFDALGDDASAVVWHPSFPGITDIPCARARVLIGGGSSVGILSMSLAFVLGHRDIRLFGFDSSYQGSAGHAYDQVQPEPTDTYTVAGKLFTAAPWMARQAIEFQSVAAQLADSGARVSVFGTGLLPAIAAQMEQANAS